MTRQILVLRNEEHPCPFDDEGENAFTDEQIEAFLAMDATTSIVTCAHHEPITMANLPPGYVYTPVAIGQVKGVMHASDEEPVIPDGDPHTGGVGVSAAQAAAEAAAVGDGGTSTGADVIAESDAIDGGDVGDMRDVIGPTG